MKKFALILVILSSIFIVISQVLLLLNINFFAKEMFACSLIGFGLGAIVFGVYMIRKTEEKGK